MKQIKTLADFRKMWEEELRPSAKTKAYSCLIKSERVEFIVAAMTCADAKDIVIHRAAMADKQLTPGQIVCRRRPQFDELARQPRAMRDSWHLGYRQFPDGLPEFRMGCMYDPVEDMG